MRPQAGDLHIVRTSTESDNHPIGPSSVHAHGGTASAWIGGGGYG
jgi:hypothetical protein